MKKSLAALAVAFAMTQGFVATASAEQTAQFRAAAPQTFSAEDLQRYGLDADNAAQVAQLQAEGYQVQVMTAEEAEATYGGQWSNNTWLMIGAIALVVIAVATID